MNISCCPLNFDASDHGILPIFLHIIFFLQISLCISWYTLYLCQNTTKHRTVCIFFGTYYSCIEPQQSMTKHRSMCIFLVMYCTYTHGPMLSWRQSNYFLCYFCSCNWCLRHHSAIIHFRKCNCTESWGTAVTDSGGDGISNWMALFGMVLCKSHVAVFLWENRPADNKETGVLRTSSAIWNIQCSAIITWSVFWNILMKDTP